MNYSPNKNYQERIDKYESIISLIDDVKNLEVPEMDSDDNNIDLEPLKKKISNLHQDLSNNTDELLTDLKKDIDLDLTDAIEKYINQIENDLEESTFPFQDWADCAVFRTGTVKWQVDYSYLLGVINFDHENPKKLALYLENIVEFVKLYKSSFEYKDVLYSNLSRIKNLLKENEICEKFYSVLIYSESPYNFINSVFNEEVLNLTATDWTTYSTVIFAENWEEDANNMLDKLIQYVSKINDDKLLIKFTNNFFNDLVSTKNQIPKNIFNKVKYQKTINWDKLSLIINKLDKVGIQDGLFKKLKGVFSYEKEIIEEINKVELQYQLSKSLQTKEPGKRNKI